MAVLTFEHFLNADLFANVKKDFLKQDIQYEYLGSSGEDFQVNIERDQITVIKEKVISITEIENGDGKDEIYETEVIEQELNFYSDYLLPKIHEVEIAYKKDFVQDIRRRSLFSKDAIKGYGQVHLNKLNKILDKIKSASHLNEEIQNALLQAVASTYEFISDGYYQKNIDIPKKIPFAFSKNQVIALYYLLYVNEYISNNDLKKTDLYRLIEETAMYYDSKENSFKDIRKANKLCNELFGSIPSKSPGNTIDELKEIFTDSDFYASS
ncbi:hypothetical protein J1N09_01480 [Aureitalea sp. L0-47]|uniref:hypothetical protein n=1 Tax=Aureitalea sp. L0-47 TaxID=2816962 RepID=UPI002237CB9A|nr:hypothetical protein [Aureitalea sp. L0-47]MCW5518491.1 hypothetical protein [Aureitalea sp. L0-47]